MTRTHYTAILALALLVSACGSKNSPTAPGDTPGATQTRIIALEANLDFGSIQVGNSFSATLRIRNTGNSPLTITGITGSNNITSVVEADWTSGTIAAGAFQDVTMTFRPTGPQSYSGTITVNGNQTGGSNTVTMSGTGTLPIFSRSGTGANVFDLPGYIRRVRITGTYAGRCENFIIEINDRLVVNEILGTCSIASGRTYEGTHAVTGGVVDVQNSTGISWTITEVR